MKKVFIVLCISAVISACGGNSKSGSTDSTTSATPGADSAASAPKSIDATTPGGKLMAASDCNTCHKVDTKVIGPAFQDIAAKYPATEANIDTLANKVIHGGKGNWGDIQMAAHPALSMDDAKTIVKYILSLKK